MSEYLLKALNFLIGVKKILCITIGLVNWEIGFKGGGADSV